MINLNYSVTQQDFGSLVGISQVAVSGLIKIGVLNEGGTAAEWLHQYCGRLREQAAGRSSDGEYDLAEERARLAHHRANIAQMEQRRRVGELCEVAGVQIALSTIGVNFRNALECVADKIAARLATENDSHRCHQVIGAELLQVLDQLSKDCAMYSDELGAKADETA